MKHTLLLSKLSDIIMKPLNSPQLLTTNQHQLSDIDGQRLVQDAVFYESLYGHSLTATATVSATSAASPRS